MSKGISGFDTINSTNRMNFYKSMFYTSKYFNTYKKYHYYK